MWGSPPSSSSAVAGPVLMRWWETSRSAPSVTPEPGPAVVGGPLPEPNLPGVAEPTAGPPGDDANARAAREAHALYQRGDVAAACERYRELVARAGRDEARRSAGQLPGAPRPGRLPGRPARRGGRALPASRRCVAGPGSLGGPGDRARRARASSRGARRPSSRVSARFPNDPELLYLLADVQERQGRTREAVETLRRLLARESRPRPRPDPPRAARARAGRGGRLLEPGEPALPRALRGRRRDRRGPLGRPTISSVPTSPSGVTSASTRRIASRSAST